MSILPLVFAFIVLFSIGSYALLHDLIACKCEENAYTSFLRAHRQLQSGLEQKHFEKGRSHKKKGESSASIKTATATVSKNYQSPRGGPVLHPLAKLNIVQLLSSDSFHASALLYETAAQLIRILYAKTTVYQPDLEYRIVDLLMKAAKESPTDLTLENLEAHILKDAKNKSLYKIFKGTKTYDLFTKNGYPPLSDFISINTKKNAKPVNFHYAPRPLVLALFGEKITEQIEQVEKEKWEKNQRHSSLTSQELEPLLLKDHEKKLSLSILDPLINFSQKKEANPNLKVIDTKSGISLRATI